MGDRLFGFPRNASLAQLAEHVTVNHGVVGSSPSRGAKTEDHQSVVFCFASFFIATDHSTFGEAEMELFALR